MNATIEPRSYVPLDGIKGHYVAKRALEVAAVGNHTIMLLGPRGVGKTCLKRAAVAELGLDPNQVIVADTCACGNRLAVRTNCTCPERMAARWARKIRQLAHNVDIVIECAEVPYKEMQAPDSTDGPHRLMRIEDARGFAAGSKRDYRLGDAAERTREMATRRLGMQIGEIQRMMGVSRTIADLSGSGQIEARHLAEAVQYSPVVALRQLEG